ncbi:MAG: hypothetical protein V4613_00525 [Bacteroidota bacterium]
MKQFSLFLLLCVIGLSCSKDGKTTTFDLSYNSQATISPTAPVNLPFEVFTPPVTTNSESEFEGRNSNLSLIKSVYLNNLKTTITSPSNKSFSFLKDVYLYIQADGMDEKLIASQTNVADDIGSVLELQPTSENLKDYIRQKTFTVKLKVVTDETLTNEVKINIYSNYGIKTGVKQ